MNAGAKIATGDIFWFVHADSKIARVRCRRSKRCWPIRRIAGGCFRLRDRAVALDLPNSRRGREFMCRMVWRRTWRSRIFLSARCIHRIGGYPEIPLFEDAEFYRKLKQCGRVRQLREKIQTSARRYEALGPFRTVCFYGFIMTLYVMRVPFPVLEKMVRSYVVRATGPSSASTISRTGQADRNIHPPRVPSAE